MSKSNGNGQGNQHAITRTGKWKPKFIEALASSGNVTVAAKMACVSRKTAYQTKEGDEDFAAEWDEAMDHAIDLMEEEVRRRAVDGVDEPVVYKGQLAVQWQDDNGKAVASDAPGAKCVPLTIKRYSDVLLMFRLKGALPQKYRENVSFARDNSNDLRSISDGEAEAARLLDSIRTRIGAKQPGAEADQTPA